MLAKMGWSQGQGLGSEGKGRTHPMTAKVERLGTSGAAADPTTVSNNKPSAASKKRSQGKAEILLKTQQRYKAIEWRNGETIVITMCDF